MKKLILLSASLFMMSVSANAQEVARTPKQDKATNEKLTPEQRAQKLVDALSNEIAINTDQKTKIYDLALGKINKANEIKAKYRTAENKDGLRADLDANRKEYRKQVKAVLTPEQLETLKAKHKEMKAAGKTTSLEQD
ncbi:MAG: hypothetical protein K0S53_3173 [Bacteroidetes bacterium]|jgi:Spy/CpxP family protein refolding chaperone|nr:hypothetical protein [Bacteroidota bacterium]MDF2451953.1 hypothetical protein [Bacteroidota bacterium]